MLDQDKATESPKQSNDDKPQPLPVPQIDEDQTKSSLLADETAAPNASQQVKRKDSTDEKPDTLSVKKRKRYTAEDLLGMNDIDFDELLECADENIENTAFFASSS